MTTSRIWGNRTSGQVGSPGNITADEVYTKFHVDFYGALPDGATDSTAAVQAAIDEAHVAGGMVCFSGGTYIVDNLTMYGGVVLRGAGWQTVLKFKDSSTGAVIDFPAGQINYYPQILDLTIDGNKSNCPSGTDGIYLRSVDNGLLSNVRVTNCKGRGVHSEGTSSYASTRIVYHNVRSDSNDDDGFRSGNYTNDPIYVECSSGSNGGHGFMLSGCASPRLTESIAWQNDYGLYAYWSSNLVVNGCRFEHNNYHGVILWGQRQFVLADCDIYRNNQASSTYDGVRLSGDTTYSTTRGVIVGCNIGRNDIADTQLYGINDNGSSYVDYITIGPNDLGGNVTGEKSLTGTHNTDYDAEYDLTVAHRANTSNPHSVTLAQVGGTTDHGSLGGLADDDHTQYHNDTRGDARYAPIAKGVTNGDSHDHNGGDGAQIDHGGLAGLTDDDHTQYIKHSLATAANDFLVASGVGVFVKKTLAEVKTILGLGSAAYTASTDYAVAAKGVTNGDSHDHNGGDGAQIDHGGLAGLSDDDHTQYVRKDGIDYWSDILTSNYTLASGWNIVIGSGMNYLDIGQVYAGDILRVCAHGRGQTALWVGIADGAVTAINNAAVIFGLTSVSTGGGVAYDYKFTSDTAGVRVYLGAYLSGGGTLQCGNLYYECYTLLTAMRIPSS